VSVVKLCQISIVSLKLSLYAHMLVLTWSAAGLRGNDCRLLDGFPLFKPTLPKHWKQFSIMSTVNYQLRCGVSKNGRKHSNTSTACVRQMTECIPFSAARLRATSAWYWMTGYSEWSNRRIARKALSSRRSKTLTSWSCERTQYSIDALHQSADKSQL